MNCAADDQQPVIYGDGHQTRDFVYVKDVVQANLLAAASSTAPGQVYNVGTAHSISINTLWEHISQLAGINSFPQLKPARPGDIVHSLAGIRKARQQLDFQPAISFNKGLEMTFAWYKQSKSMPVGKL